MLGRAQVALGSNPAQALELTNAHAARFSGGNLAQEREVIAMGALVALGRCSLAQVLPQHWTRPPARSVQVWSLPAETVTTPLPRPMTSTRTRLSVVELL